MSSETNVQTTSATTIVTSPDFETAKQMLLHTINEVLLKKPSTKEEAIELFHSLQVAIGPWLVSNLPPMEQKAVLISLWAAEQIQSGNCIPTLKSLVGLK